MRIVIKKNENCSCIFFNKFSLSVVVTINLESSLSQSVIYPTLVYEKCVKFYIN